MLQGCQGIPKLFWVGTEGNYHIIIIELLGHSIQDILFLNHSKLSVPVVLEIADQMVLIFIFISHRYLVFKLFILKE